MSRRGTWLLTAAGILGPVLFWLVVTVAGFIEPGYDARRHTISELALGEHGWVQNVNFIVVGLLTVAFAAGLRRLFLTGRAAAFGPLLVAVVGLGLVASGFFPTDPVTYPEKGPASPTTAGAVHDLAFLAIIAAVTSACLTFARRFRHELNWRGYDVYSTVTGILIPVLLVGVSVSGSGASSTGVFQRVLVAAFFLWIEVIALRATRLTRTLRNGNSHSDQVVSTNPQGARSALRPENRGTHPVKARDLPLGRASGERPPPQRP
jgi:hypothetical membrane protein